MAMTLRLPGLLEAEATAYAASLGLSFTNLVAVALREYLDARPAPAGLRLPEPVPMQGKAEAGGGAPSARIEPPAKLSPAERVRRNAQAKRAGGAA